MNKLEKKLNATKYQRQYLRSETGTENLAKLRLAFDVMTCPETYISSNSDITPYLNVEEENKTCKRLTKNQVLAKVKSQVVGKEKEVEQITNHIFLRRQRWEQLNAGVSFNDLPGLRSILITGESGSGKSYITNEICKASGFKYIYVPMNSITGAGWRGGNLGDYLLQVSEYQKSNPDGFSVLFFDEIDKHAVNQETSSVEKSFDPTIELLSLFDCPQGVYTCNSVKESAMFEIDTNRCAFICAGAFSGIEKNVAKRLGDEFVIKKVAELAAIFKTKEKVKRKSIEELRAILTIEDLVSYGMSCEFMSRCCSIINLPQITDEEYKMYILTGKHSVIKKFKALSNCTFDISFNDLALNILIEKCLESSGGLRVAESILEPILGNLLNLPETNLMNCSFEISYDLINDAFTCTSM